MRETTPGGTSGPSGLRRALTSWWNAWLREPWKPLESPGVAPGLAAHVYGKVSVLVVDDNPVNLLALSALLASRGFVPLIAEDGSQAVELARGQRFDLILMDLQMPILDGWDATAAIRRQEAHSGRQAVPVIAYSSTSEKSEDLVLHGINGRLAKPCSDQELEDCLRHWCPSYRPALHGRAASLADSPGQAPRAGPQAHSASSR